MEWPLSGLRVADLSAGIAGGYCTKVLADGGAEVIKLEPPEGDRLRGWSAATPDAVLPVGEDGALFQFLACSKSSVVIDPATARTMSWRGVRRCRVSTKASARSLTPTAGSRPVTARVDSGGYLFIEGRADDTIIRGGENIAPAEIEDVLIRHHALRDAAVVGVPDEEWGERIVAAVVLYEGATADADEIRAFARARLRGSRTPDDVVIRDSLPYSPTGKLLRREIVADLSSPAAVQTLERM